MRRCLEADSATARKGYELGAEPNFTAIAGGVDAQGIETLREAETLNSNQVLSHRQVGQSKATRGIDDNAALYRANGQDLSIRKRCGRCISDGGNAQHSSLDDSDAVGGRPVGKRDVRRRRTVLTLIGCPMLGARRHRAGKEHDVLATNCHA